MPCFVSVLITGSSYGKGVRLEINVDGAEKVVALRHGDGLKVAKIPVTLKKGSNELLVKTNNTDVPRNHKLWTIHCRVQ